MEAHIIVRIHFLCLGTEALNFKTIASLEQINSYCGGLSCDRGLPRWLSEKESSCIAGVTGDEGSIPGLENCLEEGMATHAGIPAWRIPWTEEPAGLHSIRSQRVGHD